MNLINTQLGLDAISIEKVLNFLPYPFLVSEWRDDKQCNLFVNKKFSDEIGYTTDEIPTLDEWFEKAYPDHSHRTEVINAWKEQSIRSQEHNAPVILKARIQTKKNGKLWYEVKASISGTVHMVAFINVDEEIVREQELKRANENKSRTLSILSHDLRMPLGNLYSLIRLFDQGSLTPEEYAANIKILNRKIFHLLEFLDTTLEWTRNNFESINPSIQDVNISSIIDEILKLYESEYLDKDLEILVDLDNDKSLRSDREIVSIVMRNVFSNAIKFTQAGFIKIDSENHPTHYTITVQDSGTGIAKHRIDNILAGHYTPEKGTKQEKGLGLGLKLCQDVLKKVNGKIEIESEPGKGTLVRLVFMKSTDQRTPERDEI
jgi:signal transduction histidine kinase